MTTEELKTIWKSEEDCAAIKGWDFSHIHGRYKEEDSLPWDYEAIIRSVLKDEMKLLDYDTGGGEFLLSLHHPYENTAATEGYPPNVTLCRERLLPLGIDLRECKDAAHIPFPDESFDIIINRHGDFCPMEIRRLLKPGGLFITQQVGSENDRELVEMVLPGTEKPFPHENLKEQRTRFLDAGFDILQADEAFSSFRMCRRQIIRQQSCKFCRNKRRIDQLSLGSPGMNCNTSHFNMCCISVKCFIRIDIQPVTIYRKGKIRLHPDRVKKHRTFADLFVRCESNFDCTVRDFRMVDEVLSHADDLCDTCFIVSTT